MKLQDRNIARWCGAVVGGTALAALAAAGIAVGQGAGSADVAKSPGIMLGTPTTSTEPNGNGIPMAKPALKGPAALPSEEEAAK